MGEHRAVASICFFVWSITFISCFKIVKGNNGDKNVPLDYRHDSINGNPFPTKSADEYVYQNRNRLQFAENVVTANDGAFESQPIISDPVVEDIEDILLLPNIKRKRIVQERGFDKNAKLQLLELHNLYRSNVTPPAGNMVFMEWDTELEHLAQLWADGCVFAHGKPSNTSYKRGLYGQNLYLGTDPYGFKALWLWYDEYRYYDIRKQLCEPDQQCGHYVQMAWAESHRLGCGIKQCGLRYLIVCHYYQPAMKGQQMFIVAKPCSQCSDENGSLCNENLCMTWEQCKRNSEICKTAECNLKCQNCGRLDKSKCQCKCADGWDSPDCSRQCADEHARCGVNPGWPTRASCPSNKYAVAKKYCRMMCGTCNPFKEDEKVNHICCNGRLCENGYVLDMGRKPCRCVLLCPGPHCDILETSGKITLAVNLLDLMFFVLFLHFITAE